MYSEFYARGLLPSQDPVSEFTCYPELALLNNWGNALPDLLLEGDFRAQAESWNIPEWPSLNIDQSNIAELHLYYVRLGFIVSAYVNQVGQERARCIPSNLAKPFVKVCQLLKRPPILSYDGYALYNWYRLDPSKPIQLGNIDTIQNFVSLIDERWFILVHVAIESLSGKMIEHMINLDIRESDQVNRCLKIMDETLKQQLAILKRIPERMSADVYYKQFRPYISFFDNVKYEGTDHRQVNYRGESGAQSTIIPLVSAFMKIPYESTELTTHLKDMVNYMPARHRKLLRAIQARDGIRKVASPILFNRVLETLALFREQHSDWAKLYIADKSSDQRGTGRTPYSHWLQQLIDETRAYKIKALPERHSGLEIIEGDITELDVEAIVRSSSRNLYKGRGVSEQIFEVGGPELLRACQSIGRINPSEAVITSGYDLPCDAVIHVAPPRWSGGDFWAAQSLSELKACYENAIKLALDNNIETLAFVSLGTGGNQFPHTLAAQQALSVLSEYQYRFRKLIVCLANSGSLPIWRKALESELNKRAA